MLKMPFQQNRNFCGIENYTDQQFVIIGAPVDCATTFRSGSRFGPDAIRDASQMLTDGVNRYYQTDVSTRTGDAGNMALPTGNTNAALIEIENNVQSLISNEKHVITLGGDHSITYGILKALHKKYGKVSVLHFDAHCDTWSSHFSEKHGHGTWMYHAIEEKLIDPARTISIGIRSPCDNETAYYLENNGGLTISACDAMALPQADIFQQLYNKVSDTPIYLSLDIDCLDPAYAPGTGTPEIGGLTTMWLSKMFNDLLYKFNFVGMDCVEVCPAYDNSQITSLAAATFVWQYLSMNISKVNYNVSKEHKTSDQSRQ